MRAKHSAVNRAGKRRMGMKALTSAMLSLSLLIVGCSNVELKPVLDNVTLVYSVDNKIEKKENSTPAEAIQLSRQEGIRKTEFYRDGKVMISCRK